MTKARTVGGVHTHTHTGNFIKNKIGSDTFISDIEMTDYEK